jgi:hypothetical protein
MARKVRVQYPGAIYHVMNRGDHRGVIFRSDQDRELFLKTLGEAWAKTDWPVLRSNCGGWTNPRLAPNEQSLSPGGGNAARQPCARYLRPSPTRLSRVAHNLS